MYSPLVPGDGPPLGLQLDATVDVAEAAEVLLPVDVGHSSPFRGSTSPSPGEEHLAGAAGLGCMGEGIPVLLERNHHLAGRWRTDIGDIDGLDDLGRTAGPFCRPGWRRWPRSW